MTSAPFWSGRSVFVTGHTGFKGSWLVHWLDSLGCRVSGYAMRPETTPNLFDQSGVERKLAANTFADVRDVGALASALAASTPELIIHMAAQPLVRRSYSEPAATWDVNVMGTVNVLEATRACPSVRAVVVVTTDKCYENNVWAWGYREIDALGGHDPYSASKAAAELVVQSYRRSFFAKTGCLVASARAGNVIGGGDWSEDRLIPDAVRSLRSNRPLMIRSPHATRPWQHVLDCLGGYLTLARKLLEGDAKCASAYNFGPAAAGNLPVGQMLTALKLHWPELDWQIDEEAAATAPHEAAFLYLDSSKARQDLGWSPVWNLDRALAATAAWYREVLVDPTRAETVTARQISEYMNHA